MAMTENGKDPNESEAPTKKPSRGDDTTLHPVMPRTAVDTGASDLILPVEVMGDTFLELAGRTSDPAVRSRRDAITTDRLREIFRIVKTVTGHDFSSYKTNTVMRRIERRMSMHGTKEIDDYLAMLKECPEEAESLRREFLIGVTSFFRDPEAFEVLRTTVIPRLFANRDPDEPVRIWHPCCATGEEVYSTAILFREYLHEHCPNAKVLIFATDIDESAITRARTGLYPESIVENVGVERLRTFFTRTDNQYQVKKQLREMIVFAHHNLIRDPPFSRLDLLVCRNFLIYLNTDMQMRLLSLFHQILKPGGFLFCGSSETVERHADLFVPVNKKWKLFSRGNSGRRRLTVYSQLHAPPLPAADSRSAPFSGTGESDPAAFVEKNLLERYSPPCVVVNEKYEVVHVSTRTNLFLELPLGEPTRDILRMARRDLRPALRAAIHKAFADQKQVTFRGVSVAVGKGETKINVVAEPIGTSGRSGSLVMVVFEPSSAREQTPSPRTAVPECPPGDDSSKDALIRQLEEQLSITHEQLLATIEQLESSNEGLVSVNEELMSTNEEFQATNEELQSTNEELETSREELQSLNEELVTVNAELQGKVEELNRANSDMENFLISSDIATIFLDRGFNIKRFTPAITAIFNIIPSDIGRPFRHLAGAIDWQGFVDEAERVLTAHIPIEREITIPGEGRCCIMRILPYRTSGGDVDGIVVTFIDISERKLAENALRRAKDEWERTFDSVPDLIAILDNQHGVVRVNRAMAEKLGRKPEECEGIPCYVAVHRTETPPAFCPHTMTLTDGEEHEAEVHEELLGGDFFVTTTPLIAPDGRMAGAVHVARDITERKHAEKALQRSEEQLRRLTDHLPCYVSYVDSGERYRFVNETYRSWFDLDPAAVLGLTVEELVGQENYAVIKPHINEALAGRSACFDYTMNLPGDSQRFVSVTYVPDKDAQGETQGFYVTAIDLTERKEAEKALRESEERWQFAVEGSNDGVWDRNILTGEVFFSRKWKEMLGYADEEIGNSVTEWLNRIHAEDLPRVRQEIDRHMDGESPQYSAEYRMQCRDGSYKWIFARGKVVSRAEDGKPTRFVGTHCDITERKNLEEQLYQAQKMEAVGQLAGGVAHDFNNILTAIIGYSHLVATNTKLLPPNSPVRGYVEQIHSSAERAAELTQALLAFSRKKVMAPKVLELNETVTQLEKMLRRLISENIELNLETCPDDLQVMADKGKIEQVMINLATNAKDAMSGNGILSIATSPVTMDDEMIAAQGFGKPGNYACVRVSDTGCGIDEETKKRIFEPFFTTKEVGKGTGLGLSIVYGIVKQHGGYIDVESKPAMGTTFSIYLPVAREKAGPSAVATVNTPSGGCETILLAEDDPAVRAFHKTLFEEAGYKVIAAVDGEDALQNFTRHEAEIDLFVLDVVMPKLNGIKLYDIIRRRKPDAKPLFLSGYTADILQEVGGDRRKERILDKPVDPGTLLKTVRTLLNGDPV
jgi:two-component system CheB/CheR fusion protein